MIADVAGEFVSYITLTLGKSVLECGCRTSAMMDQSEVPETALGDALEWQENITNLERTQTIPWTQVKLKHCGGQWLRS